MRGDRPHRCILRPLDGRFTPHARGSTVLSRRRKGSSLVYPACAGIDHNRSKNIQVQTSLPRMRGDRPVAASDSNLWIKFTPHARGSTASFLVDREKAKVYPACAGIDPWTESSP